MLNLGFSEKKYTFYSESKKSQHVLRPGVATPGLECAVDPRASSTVKSQGSECLSDGGNTQNV